MAEFNWLQWQLRKIPLMRKLALVHAQLVRAKQREAQWQYTQSILTGIGNLIFSWSGIERMLNTLICAYHPFASDKTRRRKLPDNLTDKIEYLVAMSQDMRLPADLRNSIKGWIPRLGRLRNHRHLIIHAMIFQRNKNSTDWFAHQLKMRDGNPEIEEIKLTNEDLAAKQSDISQLSHDMATTINPIFFGPDWRNRFGGQVG